MAIVKSLVLLTVLSQCGSIGGARARARVRPVGRRPCGRASVGHPPRRAMAVAEIASAQRLLLEATSREIAALAQELGGDDELSRAREQLAEAAAACDVATRALGAGASQATSPCPELGDASPWPEVGDGAAEAPDGDVAPDATATGAAAGSAGEAAVGFGDDIEAASDEESVTRVCV